MSKSTLVIDTPNTCGDCPFCIHTAEEKNYIGYCNASDEDYYCKALDRFMEYDEVDGGVDILGKPIDCPLVQEPKTGHWEWVQYDYNPKLGNWHCSECRNIAVGGVYKNEKAGIPIYKYCPNCGADMRGGTE